MNLSAIKYIIIALLIGIVVWLFISWQNGKDEVKRIESNYRNQLNVKEVDHKSEMIEFTFKKDREFREFVEANTDYLGNLEKKMQEHNIKLDKVTRIVGSYVRAKDTIINKIDIDSLAYKLANFKEFKIPFKDSTRCFYTKMQFVYENGTSRIDILDREYTDSIYHITTKDRNTWRFLFFDTKIFGKRIYKVNLISNCGDAKTILINNQ